MSFIANWWDNFRGAGAAAVTVPSMDGALQPNSLLDRAEVAFRDEGIANLAVDDGRAYFSCGRAIYRIVDPKSSPEIYAEFPQNISSLAGHAGMLAIGLAGSGVTVRRPGHGDMVIDKLGDRRLTCPTAVAFADEATLIVCNGSESNPPHAWRRDLMEKNRSGSVWKVDLASGTGSPIADQLGYPCGVAVTEHKGIIVSEPWKARLLALSGKNPDVLLDDLPGYPGNLSKAGDGGLWLSIFAPRRQLVEFVLREDNYRKRMMEMCPEEYWIAPALRTGKSYFEPVQGGGVRRLGILKPWAPTRSYGLVVHLDADLVPTTSYHSRGDAERHGIGGCVEFGDRLLVASTGAGLLLSLDPTIVED